MRRWIGNRLITLAYQIAPEINAELCEYINQLMIKQAEVTAQQCLHEYQRQVACIAARQ